MNIPILKELERLKVAHAGQKVNSSVFQPNENDQKALIARNAERKEAAQRAIEEKLKEADAKTKEAEKLKAVSNNETLQPQVTTPDKRAQTAPSPNLSRAKSFKMSIADTMRPNTSHGTNMLDEKKASFDELIKYKTTHHEFSNELQQMINKEGKDSRHIFEAIFNNYKNGGISCQFSPKHEYEVIDISTISNTTNNLKQLSGTLRLEDINTLQKKKDGIALFFDPNTNTNNKKIKIRIYYQKMIDIITTENTYKDYIFQSNGNYYGLELIDEYQFNQYNQQHKGGINSKNNSNINTPAHSPRNETISSGPVLSGTPTSGLVPNENETDDHHNNNSNSSGSIRSLPGWSGRPPIFIPSSRCSIQIIEIISTNTTTNTTNSSSSTDNTTTPTSTNTTTGTIYSDAITSYYLSKLRIFAVPAISPRAAIKKLHEFCSSYFVQHTSNLVVNGKISALNLASLHGNLEVILWVLFVFIVINFGFFYVFIGFYIVNLSTTILYYIQYYILCILIIYLLYYTILYTDYTILLYTILH